MAPMDKANVEELTSQHASLAAQIDEEEHRPLPDMLDILFRRSLSVPEQW